MVFKKITALALKKRLLSKRLRGLALDIDDTLSYTDHHWIEQMSTKFGNPENLTREQVVEKYKWIEAVPYWKSKEAVSLMKKLMHSNSFQETIPLIENANYMVQKINEIVPVVTYITARPSSVARGTISWLRKHSFPAAPIIFQPFRIRHEVNHYWKANLLKSLYPEVIGIIDDSPSLADELKSIDYRGTFYLYDSGNNTKKYSKRHMFRCRTWNDVFDLISRSFVK